MDMQLDMQAILAEARQRIIDESVASVKEQVKWTVGQELRSAIHPIVAEYVKKEIEPELKELLVGQKSSILEAAAAEMTAISGHIAKALTLTIAENMGTTYRQTAIMKALLGVS